MRYPLVIIGETPPKGWGREYPCFTLVNIRSVREFLANYSNLDTDMVVGLDARSLHFSNQQAFLKLLEDTTLSIILRLREPVVSTILSRAGTIVKNEKVKRVTYLESVLNIGTPTAEKIKDLLNVRREES